MAEEYTGDVVPLAAEYKGEVRPLSADSSGGAKSAEASSTFGRFMSGLRDPIEGGAQLISHLVPKSVSDKVDSANNFLASLGFPLATIPKGNSQAESVVNGKPTTTGMDELVKQHEKEYQAERAAAGEKGFDWARTAGNVANPVNYLPIMRGAGLARAAVAGATTSALQPVTEGGFAKEKGKQVALGAGIGGALGVAGNTLSAVARGATGPVRELMDAGVNVTPGQASGGIGRRAEEAAKSVPVLGSVIRGAEGRAMHDFNRATINHALAPIGAALPEGVTGREAIAAGQEVLSHAYDTLLPNVTFGMDGQFAQELTAIRQTAREMPRAQSQQFETILQNRLGRRANPSGRLDGEAYQQVQSELGNLARNYRSSSDAAQRDLGTTLGAVATSMRDTLERQNPNYAPQLREINRAYAMFTRVESAANRRAGSNGVFTPADLLQAVKTGDRSTRRRSFARGDAMLQDWAQSGHEVLGNRLPDSGTTERALWDLGGGGLLVGIHNPLAMISAGAAMLPYTSPAMRMVRAAMTAGDPQSRNALADMMQQGAGRAIPALAAGGTNALVNGP